MPPSDSVTVSDLMSRCAKCNGLGYEHMTLAELEASAEGSEGVPEKVRRRAGEAIVFGRSQRGGGEGVPEKVLSSSSVYCADSDSDTSVPVATLM
jgi:hypothetical protein